VHILGPLGHDWIPYDVPRPHGGHELTLAGLTLHRFYEELGVVGGGCGLCCGLRIDHVLLAVTEGHIRATAHQPLMALMECMYKDTLLPMVDSVVVSLT
jgi:hypothetical protein